MVSGHKWKKNLYENTGFPDNYTHETFLKDLRINTEVQEISLIKCIAGATVVVQELCIVVLFVLLFVYMLNDWVTPVSVFVNTSVLTLIGFMYYRWSYESDINTTVRQDIRTLLIFVVFGQIFSPVLHTLTDTISTDTIYTATALMMFTHLVFFDYGLSVAIVSNSLSLCAAMFGSICLASRLASPFHAFVLMTVAIEGFVLLPGTKLNTKLLPVLTITTITLYLLFTVSISITILLACTIFFINFVCPLSFLRWQKYKNNIYGPWDEAIVDDVDNVNQLSNF